jgi:hypothetical protein
MKLIISELWSGMRKCLEINIVKNAKELKRCCLVFCFWGGGVPGTNPLICSWHRTKKLFLAQNEEVVPGTERRSCSWHRTKKLFLAQNEEIVPGTERRNCPWHRTKKLFLAQNVARRKNDDRTSKKARIPPDTNSRIPGFW